MAETKGSDKVTLKIPRPLYDKLAQIIEGTGYSSVTEFAVYVLRDLAATHDLAEAMQKDAGVDLAELKVDGGASLNDDLLQFQADLLGVPVQRPVVAETTALGAAYLAGLAVGYWQDTADVARNWALDREFEPSISAAQRQALERRWQEAVRRTLDWEDH